jgi:hypothetical protein
MTADLTASAERALAADAPQPFPGRYRVVRQYSYQDDVVVSSHRYGWVAELVAIWKAAQHPADTGVHFDTRRADS